METIFKNAVCLFLLVSLAGVGYSDNTKFSSREYLGQKPPGMTPKMFAPGIVSTDDGELNAIVSPDGREFYFCRYRPSSPTRIMVVKLEDGKWTAPRVASFSGTAFSDVDPSMSPDGKRIYFGSSRPNGNPDSKGCDIWVVNRSSSTDKWSQPVNLGKPVNTPENENYPFTSRQGTLYFLSRGHGGYGDQDIFRSELRNGKYLKPENLGKTINSKHNDFDPYIAPDESYLIFSSKDRPGGMGSSDLYISFRKKDGSWTSAKNMGKTVNSPELDFCPMVTPDGKYLFFTSRRAGNGDIYWVSSKIIRQIRTAGHS